MTRAEFLTVVLKVAALGNTSDSAENPFKDVPADAWFTNVVLDAYNLGIVSGYNDGTFGPADQVTRGQGAVMVVRAYDKLPKLMVENEEEEEDEGVLSFLF